MVLSSGNFSHYLTGKDVLPEKYFLEKAATIKFFENSLLDSKLKKQTYIAKKPYQGLGKVYEFDKKDNFKKLTNKSKNKKIADLNYDDRFNFNKYRNNENLMVFLLLQKLTIWKNFMMN